MVVFEGTYTSVKGQDFVDFWINVGESYKANQVDDVNNKNRPFREKPFLWKSSENVLLLKVLTCY
jgi:hypothetical protein